MYPKCRWYAWFLILRPSTCCKLLCVGDSNKHRYVVATQSQSLRTTLRAIPSVPIVHINRVVMVLEPPSDATLRSIALVSTLVLATVWIHVSHDRHASSLNRKKQRPKVPAQPNWPSSPLPHPSQKRANRLERKEKVQRSRTP